MSGAAALQAILERYFEAIHQGDVAALREVFHPAARLYSVPGGQLRDVPLEQWLSTVAARPAPASAGQAPSGRILATDQSGPDTAFAKVCLRVGDLRGTDYLALARLQGAWRIVSKTYHVEPAA